MSLLRGLGYAARLEARLGWTLIVIAVAMVCLVSILLLAGIYRRRGTESAGPRPRGQGIAWIVLGGIALPIITLAGVLLLTVTTMSAVVAPGVSAPLSVTVIGHRWWWEVRYPGASPDAQVTTANEIHIPVGRQVRLELRSADVIHSFWTPELAGKTDLIPGQVTGMWIEAERAGTYRGQCGEYCGAQHAHMSSMVIAESPDHFARWLELQRHAAAESDAASSAHGRDIFLRSACSLCHTIRGTVAGGRLGPDLTHLASRATIAAGTLANTSGNLTGWIANPQAFKPGTIMPAVALTSDELSSLVSYLATLR